MQQERRSTRRSTQEAALGKRAEKEVAKRSQRVSRALAGGQIAAPMNKGAHSTASRKQVASLPIVNVNVSSHGSLQIVDLSTNLNISSHSEEYLRGDKKKLSELQPLLKLVRRSTIT